jgi:hypothetical protein
MIDDVAGKVLWQSVLQLHLRRSDPDREKGLIALNILPSERTGRLALRGGNYTAREGSGGGKNLKLYRRGGFSPMHEVPVLRRFRASDLPKW